MSEEVKPESIKNVQGALSKYIKKPPLTEKLLKKPPFRFLHDIVTSVMRETGFLEGTFTSEELNSENIKDRAKKIEFLDKLISGIKAATGLPISAKPSKIVAGLEVNKTLELLQALGIALDNNKVGNAKIVEQVKEKKQSKKTSDKTVIQASNESSKNEKNKRKINQIVEENGGKTGNESRGDEAEQKGKEKKDSRKRDKGERSNRRGESREGEKKKREKEGSKSNRRSRGEAGSEVDKKGENEGKVKDAVKIEENNQEMAGENETLEGEQKTKLKEEGKDGEKRGDDIEGNEIRENGEIHDQLEAVENQERIEQEPKEYSTVGNLKEEEGKITLDETDKEETKRDEEVVIKSGSLQRPPSARPRSSKVKERPSSRSERIKGEKSEETKIERLQKFDSGEADGTNLLGNIPPFIQPPIKLARPSTAKRPPSARPGAPRLRDRGEIVPKESESSEVVESKPVPVIVDSEALEEDKENLVVLETQVSDPVIESGIVKEEEEENAIKQFQLIKTSLEDGGSSWGVSQPSSMIRIDWEGSRRERREAWEKEVQELREGIQKLTRAANPLGKLFDFLQEDIDSMNKELHNANQANSEIAEKLKQEKRIMEESLESWKRQLAELDLMIESEKEAMRIVKASILANNVKIHSLINRGAGATI